MPDDPRLTIVLACLARRGEFRDSTDMVCTARELCEIFDPPVRQGKSYHPLWMQQWLNAALGSGVVPAAEAGPVDGVAGADQLGGQVGGQVGGGIEDICGRSPPSRGQAADGDDAAEAVEALAAVHRAAA